MWISFCTLAVYIILEVFVSSHQFVELCGYEIVQLDESFGMRI